MDRLGLGEKIAAASGLALFGVTFLDWFGLEDPATGKALSSFDTNAWGSLDWIPGVLMATAVIAIVMVVFRLRDMSSERIVTMSTAATLLGLLSLLLIGYRVLDPPDLVDVSGVTVETTRKIGLFLSLAPAAGVALGGFLTSREEAALASIEAESPHSSPPPSPSSGV
jgi:hypothetical protein